MTSSPTAPSPTPARPAAVAPAVATEPVPPGYWEREVSHCPQPLSPLLRTAFLPAVNAGFATMFDELGVLPETVEYREIRGWTYTRLVPPGGKDRAAPPDWMMPVIRRIAAPFRRSVARAAETVATDRFGGYVERWHAEWHPELRRRIRELRTVDVDVLDHAGRTAHLDAVHALITDGALIHFRLQGANAVLLADLAFTCRDLLGWDTSRTLGLLRGCSTPSSAPGRRIAALADIARRRPTVRALVERADTDAVEALTGVDADFAADFSAYRDELGYGAIRYEVADPTVAERPELILALVRDQLLSGFDPAAEHATVDAAREQARAEARAQLTAAGDRARFEHALSRAERFYPIREGYGPPTMNEPLALLRHAALALARRGVAAGALHHVDDVFLLEFAELRAAATGDRSRIPAVLDQRRAERAWVRAHPGPDSYGTPPPPPPSLAALPPAARFVNEAVMWLVQHLYDPHGSAQAQAGTTEITGTPAAAGRYTGPVRIIRDETQFDRLRPGDVLVCPITSPAWSVLFPNVGALITDTGGILSHPAIIAREFGIPAVVATGNATSLLVDGQTVTVDGATGTIRPMDREPHVSP